MVLIGAELDTLLPPKQQLRLLTLNTCLLPSYVFQSAGDDNREQRATLIQQMIQRYDVVACQEVFGTSWCDKWRQLLSSTPNMQSVLSDRPVTKVLDSGLLILSKYPIVAAEFHRFKSKPITNSIIDRGFLYAQIQIGAKQLHVINTHLNPTECSLGFRSSAAYRAKQLTEIQTFMRDRLPPRDEKNVWVVMGDFNDDKVVFSLPKDMMISLVYEQPPTSHRKVPYALPGDAHYCIDYIVTSNGQSYSKLNLNLVSDHYGVEVGLLL